MTEINRQAKQTNSMTPLIIGSTTGFLSLFAAREHNIWNEVEDIYDKASKNADAPTAYDLALKRAMYATSIEQVQKKAKFWKKFGLAFGALSLLSFAYYAFMQNNNSKNNF